LLKSLYASTYRDAPDPFPDPLPLLLIDLPVEEERSPRPGLFFFGLLASRHARTSAAEAHFGFPGVPQLGMQLLATAICDTEKNNITASKVFMCYSLSIK